MNEEKKTVEIIVSKSYKVTIDEEDYGRVMNGKWYMDTNTGYTRGILNDKYVALHRLIMDDSRGMIVDHIDHNRRNNSKSNLRVCTASENQWNISKTSSRTSSKHKGVSWSKSKERWIVTIKKDRKQHYIGSYKNEDNAGRAYNEAAQKMFGKFANTNIFEDEV